MVREWGIGIGLWRSLTNGVLLISELHHMYYVWCFPGFVLWMIFIHFHPKRFFSQFVSITKCGLWMIGNLGLIYQSLSNYLQSMTYIGFTYRYAIHITASQQYRSKAGHLILDHAGVRNLNWICSCIICSIHSTWPLFAS